MLRAALGRVAGLNRSDQWLYRLGVMAGLVGSAHLSLNLFSGSLSLYLERERGYSVSAVGFGVGIAYVVQVAATLLVGPVVDRWGPRIALEVGPTLYFVARSHSLRRRTRSGSSRLACSKEWGSP